MLISRTELLAKLPLFRGLSEKQLSSIVDVGSKAFFEAGDKLITKDEAGHASFLIMTGSAISVDFPTPGRLGEVIHAGSLVGELAMLVDTVHSFTVKAREKVRAMAIPRDGLTRAMERDPSIAEQISDNLLIRLKALAHDLRSFDGILEQVGMVDEVRVTYNGKQRYSSVTITQLSQQSSSGTTEQGRALHHHRDLGNRPPAPDTKQHAAIPEPHPYIRRAKMLFKDISTKSVA